MSNKLLAVGAGYTVVGLTFALLYPLDGGQRAFPWRVLLWPVDLLGVKAFGV